MVLKTLSVPSISSTTHLTWSMVCIRFIRLSSLRPALANPTNGMVEWDTLAPRGVALYTCVPAYKYKSNEEGCRDNTMPITFDTRRHCDVGVESNLQRKRYRCWGRLLNLPAQAYPPNCHLRI